MAGCFDPSLERYRTPRQPQTPSQSKTQTRQLKTTSVQSAHTLLELWDRWVSTLELSEQTKADHYEMIRRMLVKANPKLDDTTWMVTSTLAPATYNKRLSYVKRCFKWAVETGLTNTNPYAALKNRKEVRRPVKPFTEDELRRIVQGFDTYAPHYTHFVKFLILTGVRLSEAIGLRWEHVDFKTKQVLIHESLSKDRAGDGYKRVRKERKTGSITYLPMNQALYTLLQQAQSNSHLPKGSLVFVSPTGKHIDGGNFREDYWIPILKKMDVPYRNLHNLRHSFASHALEQGIAITGVAYLLGHTDTRMVMKTYGHMVNRPDLPDLKL
ncbi:site-specific integrase [Leptolyngbya sp. UWPOB_LEPTO1]|uniref:tyrosine-type recombinase/integrase n=1 Tax=Leptolyngbya sp. UWPOB_LEPTO1 TaxID=2815653 RepID=UPI00338E7DE6